MGHWEQRTDRPESEVTPLSLCSTNSHTQWQADPRTERAQPEDKQCAYWTALLMTAAHRGGGVVTDGCVHREMQYPGNGSQQDFVCKWTCGGVPLCRGFVSRKLDVGKKALFVTHRGGTLSNKGFHCIRAPEDPQVSRSTWFDLGIFQHYSHLDGSCQFTLSKPSGWNSGSRWGHGFCKHEAGQTRMGLSQTELNRMMKKN